MRIGDLEIFEDALNGAVLAEGAMCESFSGSFITAVRIAAIFSGESSDWAITFAPPVAASAAAFAAWS